MDLKAQLMTTLQERKQKEQMFIKDFEAFEKAKKSLFSELTVFVEGSDAKVNLINQGSTSAFERDFSLDGTQIRFSSNYFQLTPDIRINTNEPSQSLILMNIQASKLPDNFRRSPIFYDLSQNSWKFYMRSTLVNNKIVLDGDIVTSDMIKTALIFCLS